jgi:hypothetical protein
MSSLSTVDLATWASGPMQNGNCLSQQPETLCGIVNCVHGVQVTFTQGLAWLEQK